MATLTGGRTRCTSTHEVDPWSDQNVRWALSYYLDRQQIIDIAWLGASLPSTLFVPDYPPLKPFLEAVQPLIDEISVS